MLWAEPVIGSSGTPSPGQKKRLTKSYSSSGALTQIIFAKRSQRAISGRTASSLLAIRQHHQIIAPFPNFNGGLESLAGQQIRRRVFHRRGRPRREIERQPVAITGDPQLTNKTGAKENRRRRMVEIFENNVRSGEGRVAAEIDLSECGKPAQLIALVGTDKESRFRIDYAAGPFSGAHRRLTTR